MEKLPPRYKAKCKECGTKHEPSFFDKHKKKWVYICKDCCGFKYTKEDNRTIEEKYDKEVLSFIRKQFNRKFMSFPYNPTIINKRRYSWDIEIANMSGRGKIKKIKRILKRKVNHNLRSYSYTAIREIAIKHFEKLYEKEKEKYPNKEIKKKKMPPVDTISRYFRKLYGAHVFRRYGKRDPYAERDSFT
jgi:hypothetical protein